VVFLGRGDGTFNAGVTVTTPASVVDHVIGDFDGDGFADIAATRQNPFLNTYVLTGRGDGSFNSATSKTPSASQNAIAAADLNRDGVLDLATATNTSANIFLGETRQGVAPLLQFSLTTIADARQALPLFKQKYEQLSRQRGQIGSFQRKISSAAEALQVARDNVKSAESRIRDADIAQEAGEVARLSILQQVGSSILAQANQQAAVSFRLLK
jgi:flagellin-like hook-associated protein FlgL